MRKILETTAAVGRADDSCLMLADDEGRYSLWPSGAAVPEGWTVVLSTTGRRKALDAIGQQWGSLGAVTFAKRGSLAA